MRIAWLAPIALALAACGPNGGGSAKCADILPGDLVITEVFADYAAPPNGMGTDAGKEWFEVYNASSAPIDMEGLTVTASHVDGTSAHSHTMRSFTVQPGAYAVLGDVDPQFVTGFIDYGYGTDLGELVNGGGKIAIGCGSTEIDNTVYKAATSGQSTGFDGGAAPDYTANDNQALWCDTPVDNAYQFEPSNFGTPGMQNFDCQGTNPGMCTDNGTLRATVPPVAGDLVITEMLPNPSGDDTKEEWFEAFVVNDVDLNGIGLDRAGDTASPNLIQSDACLHATAGSYVVFARSTDMALNGMLPRVDGTFTFSMVDTGDVRILAPSGDVVDAVTWTNAGNATTRQLDPDFTDATANDTEGYWCDATVAWAGGDKGSPLAANEHCTILPPPGMCMDNATQRAIVPPTAGQLVITEVMPSPSGDDTKQEWFEVRANAPVDLNELQLDRVGDTANPNKVASASCIHLDAGQYGLFARSADSALNGGLPAVDATFTFSMPAAGDARVLDSQGNVIDAVTWTAAANNKARQLSSSIIAAADAATQNDTLTNWCDATTTYNGTDTGTPRADNDVQCP